MSTRLRELLEGHVDRGTIPGGVTLLGRGDACEVDAVGAMAVGGPAMRADAVMRIQSMTKPVTTVATLRHVQAGRLGLDDPIQRWLPELADRRVVRSPGADLDDTVPAHRPITVRDLLTNASGYGMVLADVPLAAAMREAGVEAGPEPPSRDAGEWLTRLAALPLAHQPGDGFRYHHSFSILGLLLARLSGRSLQDHLIESLFAPLGMVDTGLWVPLDRTDRLPAAYRHEGGRLVETEPAGGGFYAGPPPFDVAHGELVSTAADLHRFARLLVDGGRHERRPFLDPDLVAAMTRDQVPDRAKTPDSFVPGFWEGTGWGFGGAVQLAGPHAGRYGWSGGQGTDFFVDPRDGTVAILLTQVELGETMWPLLEEFQSAVESA
ncbi:serine hydrolase domain-containing protein [Agilicoccus flavus]|uniref:serine hydrolase domain-containing protein n=1 Tax=Agilicoccus flavus TaxID=2775968 RepID=UPI001CF662BB|nr:serine hydrolase domain-containing protein [Agilicoccus flavus]